MISLCETPTSPSTPPRYYLAFHGDYSALKGMGFVFQKLYANNYQQWELETEEHLSSIRVWRKGARVTVDELVNYEGSFFANLMALREQGEAPPYLSDTCIEFIKDTHTHTAHFDSESFARFDAQRRAVYAHIDNVNARYSHLDDFETRTEAAKQDGITFPKQRYQQDAICMKDIKPVIDMIDSGWIVVTPRPAKREG